MTKSDQLASSLKQLIENQTWLAHAKLPSLRQQAIHSGFSLMTVLNAYQELEAQGLIYSKHKSGYYVAPLATEQLHTTTHDVSQHTIKIHSKVFQYLKATQSEQYIPFGSAFPNSRLLSDSKLFQILGQSAKHAHSYAQTPSLPPGNYELRKLIAQRYAMQGIATDPSDIVITSGGLDALNLALQATTQRGDSIVLQENSFYGAWQIAERLGLNVITVSNHPKTGLDLVALSDILQQQPIKVCFLMLNSQNPMGYTVSDEDKAKIYQMLLQQHVYLIEDDVYEELYYSDKKPISMKYYDHAHLVLHCSSFSKTLGAGFRIGWIHAAQFSERIQHLQLMSTLSVNPLIQNALVEYVSHRYYEKHLKILRLQLSELKQQYFDYLQRHLPKDCQVYLHHSGYFLWIELPPRINNIQLYEKLLSQQISTAPSDLFNTNNKYTNAIRINCSFEVNFDIKNALQKLIQALQ